MQGDGRAGFRGRRDRRVGSGEGPGDHGDVAAVGEAFLAAAQRGSAAFPGSGSRRGSVCGPGRRDGRGWTLPLPLADEGDDLAFADGEVDVVDGVQDAADRPVPTLKWRVRSRVWSSGSLMG